MIVGTAGHIDHGKSTLVHALTGTDPSRLAEEKRRGISIELGYAFLDTPDGSRIGFIDVPGHERLVHTMLAGATGIDAVMLLVAADDGVMPQTREHLAIVSLLGLRTGIVVVTKTDRVTPARVAEVFDDARRLVAGSTLADAPVVAASAIRGDGLDELKHWLAGIARRAAAEPAAAGAAGPRLAIDRAFTLDGIGTVVTGTVFAGQVAVGDALRLVPGESSTRARSVHAQNRVTDRATRGQRCAVNVAGLAKEAIVRGSWLCAPSIALQTERIDVALSLWREESQPLRSGTAVHVHAGAADVMARVVLLDDDALAPGQTRLAQLILQAPIAIWRGDRLVLRDASATRTVAGGVLLDPFAPVRYRRTPQRLAELRALGEADSLACLAACVAQSALGIDLDRWLRAEGLDAAHAGPLIARVDAKLIGAPATPGTRPTDTAHASLARWAISHPAWAALRRALLDAIRRFHDEEPQALGVDTTRLRRLAAPRVAAPIVDHAIRELLDERALARHGVFVHDPEHGVVLAPAEARLAERMSPLIAQREFDPPWVRDLARELDAPETMVRHTLARMAIGGQVFQVVRDLYYSAAAIERLAAIVRDLDASSAGGVQAAAFRDRTGLGRKRAIQVLEFFDRIGLLRRVRDTHLLRPGTELFMRTTDRAP